MSPIPIVTRLAEQPGRAYFVFFFVLAVIYGEGIASGFFRDDYWYFYTTPSGIWYKFLGDRHLQLFYYATFYVLNNLWFSPIAHHLINFLLFFTASILAYRVCSFYLKESLMSLLVVTFWLVVPWQSAAGVWISERNDLLVYNFTFLAILAFNKKKFFQAWLGGLLAFLSKSTAVFLLAAFAFQAYALKKWKLGTIFLLSMMAFLIAALWWVQYQELNATVTFAHDGFPTYVMILNRIFHMIEVLFLQLLPLPYFLSPIFLITYVLMLLFLGYAIFKSGISIKSAKFSPALAAYTFVYWLPAAASAYMRTHALFTFFIFLIGAHAFIAYRKRIANSVRLRIALFLLGAFWFTLSLKARDIYNKKGSHYKRYTQIYSQDFLNNYYEFRASKLQAILGREKDEIPFFFKFRPKHETSSLEPLTEILDYKESLGLEKVSHGWRLRVWSPTAESMEVKIYDRGEGGNPVAKYNLSADEGIWKVILPPSVTGKYYTIQARIDGETKSEVVDPYAKLLGINGHRGYIQSSAKADPIGWEHDRGPEINSPTDIILYEIHVRDFSVDSSSGIDPKGKFLSFAQAGTKSSGGLKTGLDHVQELGVTHVHLLPSFDFRSIDETKLDENNFNWGYDPQNYNALEGSYATDPYDPLTRVTEFKQLVMALHSRGIGVIMDVVYNHTGFTETSLFNQIAPDYYYRIDAQGNYSDASACGNEIASERPMVRKFILESVKYWVEEYHIDGFRFDLMGIHDIETMNLISEELKSINPNIFIYGEGWTAGDSPLPDSLRALKANTGKLKDIAAFSDDLRDGIKGSVFEDFETGFVTGNKTRKESIHFGIVGATNHPQVEYEEVNYSKKPWAPQPGQCINYVSCHDNLTLWDKLRISQPDTDENQLIEMHKLANTIVLLAQGVPFLHAGVEFLRSKNGQHNSYQSSDLVNSIKWSQKEVHKDVYDYYRQLIALRKAHPAFRLRTTEEIVEHLEFMEIDDPLVVGFWLQNNAGGDEWERIGVIFNGSDQGKRIPVDKGKWHVELADGKFKKTTFQGSVAEVGAKSALIIHN